MTFGDADYYRRQYFAARARANQWEDRAVQDELEIVRLRETIEELIARGNEVAERLRAAQPYLVWAASMPGLELEAE